MNEEIINDGFVNKETSTRQFIEIRDVENKVLKQFKVSAPQNYFPHSRNLHLPRQDHLHPSRGARCRVLLRCAL